MGGNHIAPKIGLDNVVIAEVLSDDENGIVYGEVMPLKGAVNASVSPNSDVSTDYGDNGPFFAANSRGNTELALELIDVEHTVLSKMLGQKNVNGITVETSMDQAPYFAMGFRVWVAGKDDKGNNMYQLFWYAKGKFSVPETGGETKKESLDFKHLNMTGQFVPTLFVPEGQDTGTICTHCRTDSQEVSAATVQNWFNAPIISATANIAAVTVSATLRDVPYNDLVITGAKADESEFNFAEASIRLGENIIVTDAEGAIVRGSVTVGSAGTAPTITFTPAEGENAIASVTVTGGVKDTNGVSVTPKTISLV
ncbi:MAG: hypothetical protein IJL80_01115 [Treponema sp.]|nr:hypothetical protein [Treponema sp.]